MVFGDLSDGCERALRLGLCLIALPVLVGFIGEHAQCGHRTGFHQRAAAFLFQQHGGQAADERAAAEGVQRVAVFAGQCAVAGFLHGIQNLIEQIIEIHEVSFLKEDEAVGLFLGLS